MLVPTFEYYKALVYIRAVEAVKVVMLGWLHMKKVLPIVISRHLKTLSTIPVHCL